MPFDLAKHRAEQDRARSLGMGYSVLRDIILQANSDFEDGISMGRAIEMIREIGLRAADKAIAEERAAVVAWLRKVHHPCCHGCNDELASDIERGEHRREEKP